MFLSQPALVCLLLPWPGVVAAVALATCAALPKLLWQPKGSGALSHLRSSIAAAVPHDASDAEGWRFNLASSIYWNFIYPFLFGSPLLVALCCFLKPRVCLPLIGCWVLHNRVLHRPDLADGQPWAHFAKHDWGIVTLRRFLRLRFHVSKILREHPPNKPVVIGVHPHGVAADYRVAMDGML